MDLHAIMFSEKELDELIDLLSTVASSEEMTAMEVGYFRDVSAGLLKDIRAQVTEHGE